mgnify:CR=1 FL=1
MELKTAPELPHTTRIAYSYHLEPGFGSYVKERLSAAGSNVNEFKRLSHISRTALYDMIGGRRKRISMATAIKLVSGLDKVEYRKTQATGAK